MHATDRERSEVHEGPVPFLLRCLQAAVQTGAPISPEEWAAARDWDRVLSLAEQWRLTPILHPLYSASGAGLPPDTQERLRSRYYANAARNLHLAERLCEIVDLFAAKGIRALPFKGPVMALQAYGDIALRQFDDLDFLLPQDQIIRGMDTLVAGGFKPLVALSIAEREAHVRAGWGCGLVSPGGDFHVELDASVAPGHFAFRLPPHLLWERTASVAIHGRTVPTLATEPLILLLCAHGAKHVWDRPTWIADLAGLIRRQPDIAWPHVLHAARHAGAARMLELGLLLARDVLRVHLPDPVAAVMDADREAGRLCAEVDEQMRLYPGVPYTAGAELRFHLRARERLRDRLRYLFTLAATPSYSDWKALPLPAGLFPLYYLIRPLRLTGAALCSRKGKQGTGTDRAP